MAFQSDKQRKAVMAILATKSKVHRLPIRLQDRKKIRGSGRLGIVQISFQDLMKRLGKPHHFKPDSDDKVRVAWEFEAPDGSVVSIYDYDRGYFNGRPSVADTSDWSVGGKSIRSLAWVHHWLGVRPETNKQVTERLFGPAPQHQSLKHTITSVRKKIRDMDPKPRKPKK